MNRNLLSLGLANNQIGDKGAQKLSDVLSKFILTHEEIIERRKLLSEKGHPDRKSVSVSSAFSATPLCGWACVYKGC